MRSFTFVLLVGLSALTTVLAVGQFYVPRAYYTIDEEGHVSAPVPLRRLRRSLHTAPLHSYGGGGNNGGASSTADASASSYSNGGGGDGSDSNASARASSSSNGGGGNWYPGGGAYYPGAWGGGGGGHAGHGHGYGHPVLGYH